METEKQELDKIYTAYTADGPEPTVSPISIPRIREPRDMVYSGPVSSHAENEDQSGQRLQGSGKRKTGRRISTFTAVLILFCIAVISVLYIGNILIVGRLMNQNNQFQIMHRQMQNQHELLKARIIRLSSLERIQQLAQDQLEMQYTKQIPVWIQIDPGQAEKAEEITNQLSGKQQ
jgi:cell division protein FtsL